MAVRIRLRRMGAKKRPFYRLVVVDSRMPRNGRYIEAVGYYNPLPDPPEVKVHEERVFHWLEQGAQPTDTARDLLRKTGVIRRWEERRRWVTPPSGEPEGPPAAGEVQVEEVGSPSPSEATTLTGDEERSQVEVTGDESSQANETKPEVESERGKKGRER